MAKKRKRASPARPRPAQHAAASSRTAAASTRPARRAPVPAEPQRGRWRWVIVLAAGVLIIGGFYGWQWYQARRPAPPPTFLKPSRLLAARDLPGLQTGPAPWGTAATTLRARLEADGLPVLGAEATNVHFHGHLDVYVEGRPVTVPANVGINTAAGYISPLHTHDDSGLIHVESPDDRPYTLGQLFDVWGVRLTEDCVGGYCTDGDHALRVYIGGELIRRDPRLLELALHQEIVVTYGTEAQLPDPIPSKYGFPLGS